ncbi:hypothetical protein K502DRAFT_217794 [Neoconidiobolus thromboides FSU 785]|nr:hypothetical protein K502DRAFT_217794 [Neoconidiobolus thromboides FSU 785]
MEVLLDVVWLKEDIEEKRINLITGENNSFMLDCKEKVSKVIKKEHLLKLDIICYGLGSIIESSLSRWQLAFLLSIKQEFKVVNSIQYYDPLPLTEDEETILNDYGFQILEKNEEGKRAVKEGTLFYMPHCPMLLYENVLSSNWEINLLKKVYIIGNDLTNYYLNACYINS